MVWNFRSMIVAIVVASFVPVAAAQEAVEFMHVPEPEAMWRVQHGTHASTPIPEAPPIVDWRTGHELTEAEYDAFITQCINDGFRPVSLMSRTTASGPRFTVVAHNDGLTDWVHARSKTFAEIVSWASARLAEDYEPVAVAAHGTTPDTRYSCVMVKSGDPRTFTIHFDLTTTALSQVLSQAIANVQVPIAVAGTGEGTDYRFAAIIASDPAGMGWGVWYNAVEAGYMTLLNDARRFGSIPYSLSSYGPASQPRFSLTTHYRRTENWEFIHGVDLAGLQQAEADFRTDGYYASTISAQETPTGIRFTAIFVKLPETRILTITGQSVPELAPFDDLMVSHMQAGDIPNASLAVLREGRLVLARGYTYAPAGWPTITEPDSLFRIASMSKPLCSVALHQAAEKGLIHLDDAMVSYPGLGGWIDPKASSITLRYLLQHLGGWNRNISFDPLFYDVPIASYYGKPLPISISDIVSYMKLRLLDFTPGTQYQYSNFGYTLAARALEGVDGRPYEHIVRQDVFAPIHVYRARVSEYTGDRPGEVYYTDGLHQRGTSVMLPTQPIIENFCYGGFNQDNVDSPGGWICSAVDYARFLHAFENVNTSPLLPKARIDEMWKPNLGNPAPWTWFYSSGWRVISDGQSPVIVGHDGSLPGARTTGFIHSNIGVTIVIFQNMRDPTFLRGVHQVAFDMYDLSAAHANWPTHDLFPAYCFSDFNRDRTTDLFDFLAFINGFNSLSDECDVNSDGQLDLFDFLAYINVFNTGCD